MENTKVSTRSESFKKFWNGKRAKQKEEIQQGIVTIKLVSTRIHVSAPFDGFFIDGAKEISGRWKPASRIWTFPVESQRLLMTLCEQVYGKDAIKLVGFPT